MNYQLKIKQLSNIVDRVYLECVSTDKNENTINKIFTDNKINSIEIKIIKILFLL